MTESSRMMAREFYYLGTKNSLIKRDALFLVFVTELNLFYLVLVNVQNHSSICNV